MKSFFRIYAMNRSDVSTKTRMIGDGGWYQGSVLAESVNQAKRYAELKLGFSKVVTVVDAEEFPMPNGRVFNLLGDAVPLTAEKPICLKGNPAYDLMM